MPEAIEREPCPRLTAVTHHPEHQQAAQLVVSIVGINKDCAGWLRILSQETREFQYQQGPYQSPLFCLCIVSLNLCLFYHIHILSSHPHPQHHDYELVARPILPSFPFFRCAPLPWWTRHLLYPSDSCCLP